MSTQYYYALLGVSRAATKHEVQKVWRQVARLHHPDKGGDVERFHLLQAAVEVLLDSDLRAIYDHGGVAALDEHRDKKPKADLADAEDPSLTAEDEYEWLELDEGEEVCRGEYVSLNMTTGQRMVARSFSFTEWCDEHTGCHMQIRKGTSQQWFRWFGEQVWRELPKPSAAPRKSTAPRKLPRGSVGEWLRKRRRTGL